MIFLLYHYYRVGGPPKVGMKEGVKLLFGNVSLHFSEWSPQAFNTYRILMMAHFHAPKLNPKPLME